MISAEIIRSGNVDLARQFVRSDTWKEFLQSLNRIPGYLSTGYQYNCVSAYTIALGALSSYSEAGRLLEKLTHRKMSSAEEYMEGMSQTIIAYTELVKKGKSDSSYSLPVRRACAYIADHLFVRFSLEELAAYADRC